MGLHGGIYRSCCDGCVYDGHPDCLQHYVAPPQPSDYYIPPPENRELKGFMYDYRYEFTFRTTKRLVIDSQVNRLSFNCKLYVFLKLQLCGRRVVRGPSCRHAD